MRKGMLISIWHYVLPSGWVKTQLITTRLVPTKCVDPIRLDWHYIVSETASLQRMSTLGQWCNNNIEREFYVFINFILYFHFTNSNFTMQCIIFDIKHAVFSVCSCRLNIQCWSTLLLLHQSILTFKMIAVVFLRKRPVVLFNFRIILILSISKL